MNTYIEKKEKRYIIAGLDAEGNTVYLRYLLGKKWELTPNIERASKMHKRSFAKDVLDMYYHDCPGLTDKWVIVPLIITYELVNETR